MKSNGLTKFGDPETGRERSVFGGRVIVCLSAAAMLVLGACASLPPLPPSKAQLNMETSSEELGRPLVSDTEDEGTLLGGLLGGGITFGAGGGSNRNVNMALPIGMFAGSVAGRYVAGKQAQFSKEAEVAEAITRDVRAKNAQAGRMISAMETVVAEHRTRLAEIRAAKAKGQDNAALLEQRVEVAAKDLETMKDSVGKAEGHLALFNDARGIVLEKSESKDLAQKPVMKSMTVEILTLRNRIKSMHKLIGDLSSVS
ncbi:MAG: hypothetical protein OEU46_14870 [Alphaproteobacteria bacterium]|nr:hypothetical protein [Alphaproteobacteria bacterium]